MSRLYVKVNTDMIKNQKTARGHEQISVKLCYGSKYDSRCIPVDLTVSKEGNFILWVEDQKYKEYKV